MSRRNFREGEEAPVGGWLLIAQSIDEANRRQAGGGDAVGDPIMIDFREEAADLVPAGALASFAGLADQHDEEVETMAGGIDHAMGSGAGCVAKSGEQLEENDGGMGLWGGQGRRDLRVWLALNAEQFGSSALYVGEGRQNRAVYPGDEISGRNSTLLRFRISVEKSFVTGDGD